MNNVQFIKMMLLGLSVLVIPGLFLLCCRVVKYEPPFVRHTRIGYRPWLVMVPILSLALMFATTGVFALFACVSLLSVKEYARATGLYRDIRFVVWLYVGVLAAYLSAFLFPHVFPYAPVFLLLPLFCLPLIRNTYQGMLQKVALGSLAVIVLGWFAAHIVRISLLENGIAKLVFMIACVELGDASSFILGKLFGRHKLISQISPNKTWEGAIGGLVVVSFFSWVVRSWTDLDIPFFAPFVLWAAGMGGDLFISFIKREVGVKDMGTLIPGHGGMLDRFDSLLLASPLFFYLCGGAS